jgi:hypothetical protein
MDGPLRGDWRPVMSSWEQDRSVDYQRNATTGELMLSASDVLAWIRFCALANAAHPCYRIAYTALADQLASTLIDTTRPLVDGSGS